MALFDLGDVANLTVTVRTSAGVVADAGTVVCSVGLPDGTTVTPAVAKTTTGTYQAAYTPTIPGRHNVRWVATGANAASYTDVFDVLAADPRFIISLSDAKDSLNITNTAHDEELREYLAAATDVIESIAGPVLARTVVETYDGGCTSLLLRNVPVASVTSVVEASTTLAPTDYAFDPVAGTLTRVVGIQPYSWRVGFQNIVVTYTVGSSTVPYYVILAARELIRHWYQRGQQAPRPAFGGAAADTDGVYVAGFAIPNYVVGMLSPSGGIPGIA